VERRVQVGFEAGALEPAVNALVSMVYLGELQRQAEYALNAVDQVNTATRELGKPSAGSQDRSTSTSEVFRVCWFSLKWREGGPPLLSISPLASSL